MTEARLADAAAAVGVNKALRHCGSCDRSWLDWGKFAFPKPWKLSRAKEKGSLSLGRVTLLEIATPISGDRSISRADFAFTKPKEVTGVPAQDLRML